MPKLVWNGGFELDWKTLGAIVGFVFLAGGNWIQYRDLRAAFKEHIVDAKVESQTVNLQGYRLGSLENRVDFCCPLYHPAGPAPRDLKPSDIVPPNIGGRPSEEKP